MSEIAPIITKFRVQLDSFINSFALIKPSRQVSLAFTNMERGFAWLGESLKQTGSNTPYANSDNPHNRQIEPLADHDESNTLAERWGKLSETHTARVKDFRAAIGEYLKEFKTFYDAPLTATDAAPDLHECLKTSMKAVKEARHWLGWELNRIKRQYNDLPDIQIGSLAKELPL